MFMKKINFPGLIINLTVIIVFCCNADLVSARNLIYDSETKSRMYVREGIEPSLLTTFGYQFNCDTGIIDRKVTTYGELGLSSVRFGLKNWELKTGGVLPLFERNTFKVVNDLDFSAGRVDTRNFVSYKFAFGDECAVGFYKRNWFIAATAEYERIVLNHIRNTRFYRVNFYEDAKDGWYKGAGGMFQFGFEGGRKITKKYDMHLEIMMPFTEKFDGYGGSPLHLNIELGYRY